MRIRVAGQAEFTTIQAAIDDLPPAGGVVLVPAGTWTEHLVITKANATLIGMGPTTILTAPPASTWTEWSDALIQIMAPGVRVRNLQLQGQAVASRETNQAGIHVRSTSRATVDHVLFSGSPGKGLNSGIVLDLANDSALHHDEFTQIVGTGNGDGNGYAISVNGDHNVVEHNQVVFSKGQGRHCVYLAAASHNVVSSNSCEGGTNESIPVCSRVGQSPSEYNRIEGNLIKDVRLEGTALNIQGAISLEQNARHNEVVANTIVRVGMHGIWVSDNNVGPSPDFNSIEGNAITRPSCAGIFITGANNTTVTRNIVRDANLMPPSGYSYAGILVLNSSAAATVAGNQVLNNSVYASTRAMPYALTIGMGGSALQIGNVFERGSLGVVSEIGRRTYASHRGPHVVQVPPRVSMKRATEPAAP